MSKLSEITVPDIGGAINVDVIEILVSPGDEVNVDDSLLTLESDKASMEIPATQKGRVVEIKLAVGDKVSQGDVILLIDSEDGASASTAPAAEATKKPEAESAADLVPAAQQPPTKPEQATVETAEIDTIETKAPHSDVHASPAVRRVAQEFGIDLAQISATGRKGRILKEDVQQFVKARLASSGGGAGIGVAPAPVIDFTQFGDIETKPLNKIKRLTGAHVHRSWVTIPHVTHFDEADITDLEAFRQTHKTKAEQEGYKLTPLAFIVKAVVKALQKFSQFNSSLDARAENLIIKHYYHIGVAVETPNGLVVPVIRDADKKDVASIAKDMAALSSKAREKGLMPNDMAGSCFTISSLGGIGGTAFTPIVNAPDVAILGVSKAKMQPVYSDKEFKPRLMLPLSLSYDHRVIDGAEAARFARYLSELLTDIRTLLL